MARRYFISGEVTDGDFVSEEMSGSYANCQMAYIIFYSDEFVTQATPTGGSVTFTLSPDGNNYRTVDSGTFQADQAYAEGRTPPNANGLAIRGKLNMTGVTGATHFTACVWRV